MSLPVRKKLWRQVVRAKIRNQGSLLTHIHGFDHGLGALAADVLSGDRTNVEATAAVRYWRALFDDPDFRRDPAIGGRNALLNYGYAVTRGIVARAICGAGLHPAVGLHHHSRGNPLCLADDLMEPFRPIVDQVVAGFGLGTIDPPELTRDIKARLLRALVQRFTVKGEQRTPSDIAERLVRSLARVVDGDADRLWMPLIAFE
jgi:CRISPR-associated protein Cas1